MSFTEREARTTVNPPKGRGFLLYHHIILVALSDYIFSEVVWTKWNHIILVAQPHYIFYVSSIKLLRYFIIKKHTRVGDWTVYIILPFAFAQAGSAFGAVAF